MRDLTNMVFCVACALLASGTGAKALSVISLSDFDDPAVLDFESVAAGPIDSDAPLFTDIGISSITGTSAAQSVDMFGFAVDGNGLGLIGGVLSVVQPGEVIDAPRRGSDPAFTLALAEPTTRIGIDIVEARSGITLRFLNAGSVVDSFTPSAPQNLGLAIYLELAAFDSVEFFAAASLSPNEGWALDNITLEQGAPVPVPLPASALLLLAGLGAVALGRRT
ncbi:MAG: hypothetical protein AAF192_08010 [Pseudomonadota bacterium]